MSLRVIHTLYTITDESESDVNDACTTLNWGFRSTSGLSGNAALTGSSYFPPQLNGNTAAAGLQHAQQQLTEPSRVLEVFFLTQGAFERGQRTKKDGYMRT